MSKSKFIHPLGAKVRDKLSGYEGIVFAHYDYLFGCHYYGVRARGLHEGKPIESQTFDEGQLEVIEGELLEGDEPVDALGGPGVTPPSPAR